MMQKQFSELKEQIIEFESLKVTNKRLKDDLDEMDHQLEEMNRAKQTAEIKVTSFAQFNFSDTKNMIAYVSLPCRRDTKSQVSQV